jgi:peroxiredoxin
MAQTATRPLDQGDRFPDLTFSTVRSGTVTLPRDGLGYWTVLLFYRGHF